jgi:hypothetical protein
VPRNPQAFDVRGSHTDCATHSGILTSWRSTCPYSQASPPQERSPTIVAPLWERLSRASDNRFSLVTFSVPMHSTSELLRTLSMVAASKPTSWLFSRIDPLSHSAIVRVLSCGSGLFPSRRRSLALAVSLAGLSALAFAVWLESVTSTWPLPHPALYLQGRCTAAVPQYISGRTSYLRVRLAFHPYPQVLPQFCNTGGCEPRRRVTVASLCSWVAHTVSGRNGATHTRSSHSVALRLPLFSES